MAPETVLEASPRPHKCGSVITTKPTFTAFTSSSWEPTTCYWECPSLPLLIQRSTGQQAHFMARSLHASPTPTSGHTTEIDLLFDHSCYDHKIYPYACHGMNQYAPNGLPNLPNWP